MDELALELFQIVRTQSYIHAVCISLWLYEYLCTISFEIRFIWFTPWNVTKFLFLSTRYNQFLLIGALLHQSYSPYRLTRGDCFRNEQFVIIILNVGMLLTEIIFTLRTWAVWGRSRKSGFLLLMFFMILLVPCFTLTAFWFPTLTPSPIPIPTQVIPSGCCNIIRSNVRVAEYAIMSVFYVVNATLVGIPAYKSFVDRTSLSSFARLVYIDGILYYIYLLAFSITNIVIICGFPPQYSDLFTVLQQFLGSILSCRMILNLRNHHQQELTTNLGDKSTNLRRPVVFRHHHRYTESEI